MSYRLGIDSGGTFTDIVLLDEKTGKLEVTKTLSTPENPSIGVYNGIKKIINIEKLDPLLISSLVHGTTVATNALLEYKGAETALLLTEGFIDVLSIVRQDRPKLYDYFERRKAPLVPRHRRFEIKERTLFNGDIVKDLNEKDVIEIINRLKIEGIKTVAVCLLNSYANPMHELRVKELFKSYYPDVNISLSSEILPEIREYERMSTTAINAFVMPLIDHYLTDLTKKMVEAGSLIISFWLQSSACPVKLRG